MVTAKVYLNIIILIKSTIAKVHIGWSTYLFSLFTVRPISSSLLLFSQCYSCSILNYPPPPCLVNPGNLQRILNWNTYLIYGWGADCSLSAVHVYRYRVHFITAHYSLPSFQRVRVFTTQPRELNSSLLD